MDKRCDRCPLRALQKTCGEQLAATEISTPRTRLERIGEKIGAVVRDVLPGPDSGDCPPRTCSWGSRCRVQALQRIGNAAARGFSLSQCALGESDKRVLLESLPPASDYYTIPSMQEYFLREDPNEATWHRIVQEIAENQGQET